MKKFIVLVYCILITALILPPSFAVQEQRKATAEDLERGVGNVVSSGGHVGSKINLSSFSDNVYFRASYDNAYSGTGTATSGDKLTEGSPGTHSGRKERGPLPGARAESMKTESTKPRRPVWAGQRGPETGIVLTDRDE